MSNIDKLVDDLNKLDPDALVLADDLCFKWIREAIKETGGRQEGTLLKLLDIIQEDM